MLIFVMSYPFQDSLADMRSTDVRYSLVQLVRGLKYNVKCTTVLPLVKRTTLVRSAAMPFNARIRTIMASMSADKVLNIELLGLWRFE